MNLPVRKSTRLRNFDYSNHGVYFVTICTKDKRKTLSRIVGGGAYDAPRVILTEKGKIVEKYILSTNNIKNVAIDKYVIMPNHIHMLIFLENEDGTSRAPSPTNMMIPHIVGTLKRFVNRDCGEDLFQRSFFDHIIRDYKDYALRWNYIENNPARWCEDKYYCE